MNQGIETNPGAILGPWLVGGDGIDHIGAYWQSADGDQASIDLSGTGPGSITTSLSTLSGWTTGATYRVSFSLAANPDNTLSPQSCVRATTASSQQDYCFNVLNVDGQGTQASTANMGWQRHTFEFTGAPTDHLTFTSLDAPGDGWGPALDHITVEKLVPTTGTGVRQLFTGKERDQETNLDYFEARYFGAAQGRFTSADPFNIITRAENREHFETYLSQPQNWNAYVYTWNNPLRYTDPTGETVYVIAYTTGNESGDEEFKRVAETRANEIRNAKGFDSKRDTVLIRGIRSFDDLKGLVKDANALDKSFGKVGELSIVSHAGQDGPNFNYGHNRPGGPRYTNEQNPSGIASLTVNWDSSARACFLGCRTADRYSNGGFAQSFADRQGVPSYGFPDASGFSSSPSRRSYWYVLGLGGQNLYMTNRDGRPPVRKDPTKPR